MSTPILRWYEGLDEVEGVLDKIEEQLRPFFSLVTAASIGVDLGFVAGMRYALSAPEMAANRLAVLDIAIEDEAVLDLSSLGGRPS